MPTLTHLDDAMLRAGRMVPAINRLGGGMIALAGAQPWRVIGDEAVIYQLRQSSGRVFALRCLFADTLDPGLADRYRALGTDAAIKRFRSRAFSPVVGGVSFVGDGIVVPGADLRSTRWPLIVMDWVMGPTLMAAVDRASRGNDQQYLLALAEAWRTAMLMCAEEGFVHGDLTAHNAMVRPKEGIALVDYDRSWWPTAPIVPAAAGRPGYRHPRGIPGEIERRDDFSALVVYASLRVLAVWPELRFEHGSAAVENDGVILFSAKDLANPDGSALFGKIRVIDDPVVQALAAVLRETCHLQPEEVPSFREAIHAAGNVARTIPAARPAPPPPQPTLDRQERNERVSRLNGLLISGDEDEAWSYWRSSGLADDPDAKGELGPVLAEVERRRAPQPEPAPPGGRSMRSKLASAAIDQLRAAIDAGDGRAAARIWSEVRHEPGASIHAASANQVISAYVIAALKEAVRGRDDRAVVAALEDAQRLGVGVSPELRRAARAAAQRLAMKDEVDDAIEHDDRVALIEHEFSGAFDASGATPEVERQLSLAKATPHLLRAIATDDDHLIDQAWDRAIFPDFNELPVSVHNRLSQARDRVEWLAKARAALKAQDAEELRVLMAAMPLGSEERLSAVERSRMRRLIRKERAAGDLRAALESRDDRRIVDALNELEAAGAQLPADLNWATMRGVIDRLSLIAAIRRAALSRPPDYARLSRLLPQAREESNGEAPYLGGSLDFAKLELEVQREAHRNRLLAAIERGDNRAIVVAAIPDPHRIVADLSLEQRRIVEDAIADVRPKHPLKNRT